MFINIKDRILEIYGSFSWNYINHILSKPEMYYCTGVSDFVKNQDVIVPTGFKLLKPGRKFTKYCFLAFHSCYYRKRNDEVDRAALFDELCAKEDELVNSEIKTKEDYSRLEKEIIKLWKEGLPKIAEADLHDLTGNSLHLNIGGDDVPDGKLYDVIVLYDPLTTFSFMFDYQTHSQLPIPNKKEKLRSLINLLQPQLTNQKLFT